MMTGPHAPLEIPLAVMAVEQPRRTLRLQLKPEAPTSGYVDGAWWPYSRNLSAESPELVAALAIRLGPIERITYNLTAWSSDARRVSTNGNVVRLGGFRSQSADIVTVIGTNQRRLTLLIVPPETDPTAAHRMLISASKPGNADGLATLLERV